MTEKNTGPRARGRRAAAWAALGAVLLAAGVCLCVMLHHFRLHYRGLVWPGRAYTIDNVRHTFPNLKRGTPLGLYPVIQDDLAARLKSMYRRLARVCAAHDIDVWLAGGTLVGYVRHQGFIPWDDDMDLHVRLSDKTKLLGAAVRADLEAEGLGLGLTAAWPRTDIIKVVELDTDDTDNPDALRAYPFLDVLFEGRVDGRWGTCKDHVEADGDTCTALHEDEIWDEEDVFPLQDGMFENVAVRVPRRPRALLRAQYGDKVLEGYRVDFVHWLVHLTKHARLPAWRSGGTHGTSTTGRRGPGSA